MVSKQLFVNILIITRFFTSFTGHEIFKTSIPHAFYLYMVFTFLIYFVTEKMQKRLTLFLEDSSNNDSLKTNYKIIFFTFFFLQYISIIMLCVDKIWQGNLVYTVLFNGIICFHLKELNDDFKPHFHHEYVVSIFVKFLSFFTISSFVFCFTMNNQALEQLSPIIYLSYIILFFYSICVVDSKIKCFREIRTLFMYNKYTNVVLADSLYFILSVSLVAVVATHENFSNILAKKQNGYEFIAFFCCMLNVAYSFFGLFQTIVDSLIISRKIKNLREQEQLYLIKNDIAIILSPSTEDDNNINIQLGKELPKKEPTQPNEVAVEPLVEVVVT